jgi:hypothetical protein
MTKRLPDTMERKNMTQTSDKDFYNKFCEVHLVDEPRRPILCVPLNSIDGFLRIAKRIPAPNKRVKDVYNPTEKLADIMLEEEYIPTSAVGKIIPINACAGCGKDDVWRQDACGEEFLGYKNDCLCRVTIYHNGYYCNNCLRPLVEAKMQRNDSNTIKRKPLWKMWRDKITGSYIRRKHIKAAERKERQRLESLTYAQKLRMTAKVR